MLLLIVAIAICLLLYVYLQQQVTSGCLDPSLIVLNCQNSFQATKGEQPEVSVKDIASSKGTLLNTLSF